MERFGQQQLVIAIVGMMSLLAGGFLFLLFKSPAAVPSVKRVTDYAAERARFIRARADLAEMEAKEKRRSLIAADQVEAAWIAVLALLRTRLLALPDRLAPQVFEQSTVGDTRNLIRAAIREVLDDLAEPDIEFKTDPDIDGLSDPETDGGKGTSGSETTAGPDDQRLGGPEPAAEF